MLRSAVRAARPAVFAARASFQPKSSTLIRPFSTTLSVSSGPPAPQLFGEGGKPGEVPSDLEQATGLERLQLLGEIEGIDVFDESPLDASRIGTKANPILVPSYVRVFATSLDRPHFAAFRMWNV
jgi:cytochrome c oxidase subunit 5b